MTAKAITDRMRVRRVPDRLEWWNRPDKIKYHEDKANNLCGSLKYTSTHKYTLHTHRHMHTPTGMHTHTCASAEVLDWGSTGNRNTHWKAFQVLNDSEQQLLNDVAAQSSCDQSKNMAWNKSCKIPCTRGRQILLGNIVFSSGCHDLQGALERIPSSLDGAGRPWNKQNWNF